MPEWTDEQKQVIGSREQSLLVNAGAGSGKTAVLVQRILDQILDPVHPVDIDRMVVVTFTNAAASQLKEKIRSRLEDVMAEDDAARAKAAARQIALLAGDHIETIDRFCREVVMDHAAMLAIDPAFRIADTGELKLLRSECADAVIEEAYLDPDEEQRADFEAFAQMYAPGKTDGELEGLIDRFYEFSMSHEFPRLWRHSCAELYRGDAKDSAWMESLIRSVRRKISNLHERIRNALSKCTQPYGPYHYTQTMLDHDRLLTELGSCRTMDEFQKVFSDFSWLRPGNKKRGKDAPAVDEALELSVKTVHQKVKRELDSMARKLFYAPEDEIRTMRHETGRYMDVLIRLTDAFEEEFSSQKEARCIADFSDVAHWALKVLIRTGEDGMPLRTQEGSYIPSDEALTYAEHFEEIYIDEYQDSNPVQETLLWSISREALTQFGRKNEAGQAQEPAADESADDADRGTSDEAGQAQENEAGEKKNNRFMVGDVKQSIYRFRMADPGIFIEKARSYSFAPDSGTRRIDLHANFRSRQEVLDVVNLVFRQIMCEEVGGVEYTQDEELTAGFPFPDSAANGGNEPHPAPVPELILAEKNDVPLSTGKVETEAEVVAQRILSMVGREMIYDKDTGEYRPAEYRDIAILLRTMGDWAETFSRVLDGHGIPNKSGANTGYFNAVEVRVILAYLNVLDNPRQDIPLAASMRSLIGGFCDEELAKIRTEKFEEEPDSLYERICAYSENGSDPGIRKKLQTFLGHIKSLRALVRDTPIHILLWKIFDLTGYEEMIEASEGGRQKKANLELLVDMAITYEATSYRGLFHFVRYIEKLRKADIDIGQAPGAGGEENLVRIMTMHKSKGLEFPVVFVSGLSKMFNRMDAHAALVLHEHLGAGLDWRDPELRMRRPNRIRSAISDRILSDSTGEELRVLYVAMTRAEEKLILTGCVDDRKDAVVKAGELRQSQEEKFNAGWIEGVSCMLDWVLASFVRHGAEQDFFDSGRWDIPDLEDSPVRDAPGQITILTGPDVIAEREGFVRKHQDRVAGLLLQDADQIFDPVLHERLEYMMTHSYPYLEGREDMPAKLSVSDIKHAGYEAEMKRILSEEGAFDVTDSIAPQAGGTMPETDSIAPQAGGTSQETEDTTQGSGGITPERIEIPVPDFMMEQGGEKTLSGADRGSAYHLVFATADMTQPSDPGVVRALLESMVKCDKIQKSEAEAVDPEKIAHFLNTDLALRMGEAARKKLLWREQPFVIRTEANRIRDDWSPDEQILIQGIIDAFFIEGDHIVLLDYKTDRARPGDEKSLVRRYRAQFELYRDALERLLKMPVTEAWLYSLSLEKNIAALSGAGETCS